MSVGGSIIHIYILISLKPTLGFHNLQTSIWLKIHTVYNTYSGSIVTATLYVTAQSHRLNDFADRHTDTCHTLAVPTH